MRKTVGPNTWDRVILCDACHKQIMEWKFSYEPYGVLTVRGKKGRGQLNRNLGKSRDTSRKILPNP